MFLPPEPEALGKAHESVRAGESDHLRDGQLAGPSHPFDEQFPIERAYGKVHDYHSVTGRYPNISRDNYDLFSFLGALALVDQHLPTNARRRLQSNIRGAL